MCRFKLFLSILAILFIRGESFVQFLYRAESFVVLIEGMREMILIWTREAQVMSFKCFIFLAMVAIYFSVEQF